MRNHRMLFFHAVVGCALTTGCAVSPEGSESAPSTQKAELTRTGAQPDTTNTDTFTGTAKTIVDWSGAISGSFGTIQAGVAVGTVIGQAIGLIDSTDPNTAILDQLQKLHDQINTVSKAINWHMDEIERDNRLSTLHGTIDNVNDTLNAGGTVPWFSVDNETHVAVREASGLDGLVAFERQYVDSDTDGGAVASNYNFNMTWKTLIPYTQADLHFNGGFVYDWRLGVPALTQLIALRLTLMAMEDPNFTADKSFSDQLSAYHDALVKHQNLIRDGVRCAPIVTMPANSWGDATPLSATHNWEFWISCADINTGLNNTQVLIFGDSYPLDNFVTCAINDDNGVQIGTNPDCASKESADYAAFFQTYVQPVADAAYQDVLNRTPLAELSNLDATIVSYL